LAEYWPLHSSRSRVRKDCRDYRENGDYRDHKVLRDFKESLAHKASKVFKDPKVHREFKAYQVPQELMLFCRSFKTGTKQTRT